MAIHVTNYLDISQVPRECVSDCSGPGSADAAVAYWRDELGFTVDRDQAVKCLRGYGAWDDEQLAAKDDDEIADIVLWLACGTFAEYAHEAKQAGFDPWNDDRPEGFSPNCGSDVFYLQ